MSCVAVCQYNVTFITITLPTMLCTLQERNLANHQAEESSDNDSGKSRQQTALI